MSTENKVTKSTDYTDVVDEFASMKASVVILAFSTDVAGSLLLSELSATIRPAAWSASFPVSTNGVCSQTPISSFLTIS